MITHLRGILTSRQPPTIIIDNHGIGYEVFASASCCYQLPAINETVTLLIHMIVREDAHTLYGFIEEHERKLFRILIKVSGIGPKLALTILSGIEPLLLIRAVQQNDINRLTSIPGIGKKTAQRLIMETRDALADWTMPLNTNTESTNDITMQKSCILHDAISALTALGYKPGEAKTAIQQFENQHNNVEELIRVALQHLAKGVKSL